MLVTARVSPGELCHRRCGRGQRNFLRVVRISCHPASSWRFSCWESGQWHKTHTTTKSIAKSI